MDNKICTNTRNFEIEAEECGMGFTGMIQTKEEYPSYYHDEGKDWHRSKESAVKRAEEMRQKKISKHAI